MNKLLEQILDAINQVILGKEHQIKMAICCLISNGHLLIEDIPGVGKTTLSHALAKILGLNYQRVQFTNDLLPADIIGCTIYDAEESSMIFHKGSIFHQMILADEINRATPKTQSALLEAMEEKRVTVEGKTYMLPSPFFVIATQNPSQQIGTFPLPESQLDRFLMRIKLGYPDRIAERNLLTGQDRHIMVDNLRQHIDYKKLDEMRTQARKIYCSDALLDYLQALISYTRESGKYVNGLSPRAGLALLTSAKTWAFMNGEETVLPDHIQAVLPAVAGHRLNAGITDSEKIVEPLLENVPVS